MMMIRRVQVLYMPAAGIDSGLQLSSPCRGAAGAGWPLQAAITKQIMAPRLSPLAKLIKMSIRVNPLAFSLCGVYNGSLIA